jgi:hypothetical protein
MTTPINLNKARKARARAGKEQRAKENRAKFGRTRSEKEVEAAQSKKQSHAAELHRLERPEPKDG